MEAPPRPSLGWRRIRRIRKPILQLHLQQQQQHEEKEEASTTTSFFNSGKRFAGELSSDRKMNDTAETEEDGNEELGADGETEELTPSEAVLFARRKALFEPLEPNMYGKRTSAESLLPPPDFDTASYPKGWLIGKKRKLVNVDVVESMRRIAVQEMNRKDSEIRTFANPASRGEEQANYCRKRECTAARSGKYA